MSEPATTLAPNDSILNQVKATLGLDKDYDAFDQEVMLHINSVFFTMTQLGLGPDEGFEIDSAMTPWADYIQNDKNLNVVKTYMGLRVRLLFDPPATSFGQEAIKKQAEELEWRMNVYAENKKRSNQW